MGYTRALLSFRQAGVGPEAGNALRAALEQTPHVPTYLTGRKRIPIRMPEYIGFGDGAEAVDYAAAHLNYWRRTPGAIDWLREHVEALGKGVKTKRKMSRQRSSKGSRRPS